MARSPIPEALAFTPPQGVHLAVAAGLPTLLAALGVFWVTGQGPWSWPALWGALYALTLALWAPWRQRTKQGLWLQAWLYVVPSLAYYAVLAGSLGVPWFGFTSLEGPHTAWFLLGLGQGGLAALWAGRLAPRARLHQLIAGIPDGPALEERVRDFQVDADFSRGDQAALAASLAAQGLAATLLACFEPPARAPVGTLLLAGFLVLCLVLAALLRVYRREMEALMYGRRMTLAEKLWPLGWALGLAGAAALGAWGLTSALGPLVDLSRWTLPPPVAPTLAPPAATPGLRPPGPPGAGDPWFTALVTLLLLLFRADHLVALVSLVLAALWWALPLGLVAFLGAPLVRWLLTGGRETRGLWGRWKALLAAQVAGFWATLVQLWGGGRGPSETQALGASSARDWVRSLFSRPAPGRRAPYPAVVEAFLRLVRWAEPVTTYRPGETTREFLDRLGATVPDRAADLALVRDELDQELFGPRGLAAPDREAFLARVARLTSTPASHGPGPGVS